MHLPCRHATNKRLRGVVFDRHEEEAQPVINRESITIRPLDSIIVIPPHRSKNWTPNIDATPMYKNTPNSTAMGINRRMGAMATDTPTMTETNRPDTRCSLTSTMCGLSPGAWVLQGAHEMERAIRINQQGQKHPTKRTST